MSVLFGCSFCLILEPLDISPNFFLLVTRWDMHPTSTRRISYTNIYILLFLVLLFYEVLNIFFLNRAIIIIIMIIMLFSFLDLKFHESCYIFNKIQMDVFFSITLYSHFFFKQFYLTWYSHIFQGSLLLILIIYVFLKIRNLFSWVQFDIKSFFLSVFFFFSFLKWYLFSLILFFS